MTPRGSWSTTNRPAAMIVCAAAGSLISLQSRINGELSTRLGSAIEAATLSILSGVVTLLVLVAALSGARAGLRRLPDLVRERTLPRWCYLGGGAGALFLAIQASVVPSVGVAVFLVCVVAAQAVGSLVVDRLGIGPAGVVHSGALRILAAVLGIAAVAVSVSDRLGDGSIPVLAIGLAMIAGAVVPPQQAVNGRVSVALGSPVAASVVNFTVGMTALLVIAGLARLVTGTPYAPPPTDDWWLYLGGPLGVAFIAVAAWAVKPLGILLFALLTLGGQLASALLLDLVWPSPGTSVGWHLAVGVVLAFAAAGVAAAAPRTTSRPVTRRGRAADSGLPRAAAGPPRRADPGPGVGDVRQTDPP